MENIPRGLMVCSISASIAPHARNVGEDVGSLLIPLLRLEKK